MDLLQILMDRGCPVRVVKRAWGQQKTLKPEDVGLDPQTLPPELKARMGRARLAPDGFFRPLEQIHEQAGKILDELSAPGDFLGMHFIPKVNMERLEQAMAQLQERFAQQLDRLILAWPAARADMSLVWRELFAAAYTALQRAGKDAWGAETWIEDRMTQVAAKMPASDKLRAKWVLAWERRTVDRAVQDFVEATMLALRENVLQVSTRSLKTLTEKGVKQPTIDALRTLARKVRAQGVAEDEELGRALDRMEQAADLMASGQAELLDDVKEALGEVNAEMEKGGPVAVAAFFGKTGKRTMNL